MANKRCCEKFNTRGGGCEVHSNYKLIIQLKPQFKTMSSSPTFYNWVYQNTKSPEYIFEGMKSRLLKYFDGRYNKIQFWDHKNNTLLFEN